MKNLVTGATGLVGMHVMLDLLTKKESVKATFTKNSRLENVKKLFDFYGKSSFFKKIEWVEMNVDDVIQVYDVVKDIDHVYHCAAIVSFIKKEQLKISSININGISNIKFCLENNIKLIYSATSASTKEMGFILNQTNGKMAKTIVFMQSLKIRLRMRFGGEFKKDCKLSL